VAEEQLELCGRGGVSAGERRAVQALAESEAAAQVLQRQMAHLEMQVNSLRTEVSMRREGSYVQSVESIGGDGQLSLNTASVERKGDAEGVSDEFGRVDSMSPGTTSCMGPESAADALGQNLRVDELLVENNLLHAALARAKAHIRSDGERGGERTDGEANSPYVEALAGLRVQVADCERERSFRDVSSMDWRKTERLIGVLRRTGDGWSV
jgi:hypothetical protein